MNACIKPVGMSVPSIKKCIIRHARRTILYMCDLLTLNS